MDVCRHTWAFRGSSLIYVIHTKKVTSSRIRIDTMPRQITREEIEACRYLACGGGASAGVLYIGALRALERLGFDRKKLLGAIGASIGSLISLIACAGTSFAVIESICEQMRDFDILGEVNVARLVNGFGLNDGTRLRTFISNVMEQSGLSSSSTFVDFHRLTGKRLVFVSTNLTKGSAFYWSAETTPYARLLEAMYASMCLPILFVPTTWDGDTHVDGCLTALNPSDVFPMNETIVLQLCTKREATINTWQKYANAIVSTMMSQVNDRSLSIIAASDCVHRVLMIDNEHQDWMSLDIQLLHEGDAQITWALSTETRELIKQLLLLTAPYLAPLPATTDIESCTEADHVPAPEPPEAVEQSPL